MLETPYSERGPRLMEPNERPEPSIDDDVLRRLQEGDSRSIADVFMQFRPRLRRMVELRLDDRLRGRLDPSDVLQEAFIEYAQRVPEYASRTDMPFFLWVRMLTGQKLLEIHRRHIDTKARDVNREIHVGRIPNASTISLASKLLGRMATASSDARRSELKDQLHEVLNRMRLADREVLSLRHFEGLSNLEIAAVLGLSKAAASNRYVRALQRLKDELAKLSGFSVA